MQTYRDVFLINELKNLKYGIHNDCDQLLGFITTTLKVVFITAILCRLLRSYKITEIVRVIWLVKNLWFIILVNP